MPLEKGQLGNAIRQARIENNISQEALAEMVGITPSHLKHIESEHRKPSVEILFRIAQVLHMSLDHVIFQPDFSAQYKIKEIDNMLTKCSVNELQIILDVIRSLQKNRDSFDTYC